MEKKVFIVNQSKKKRLTPTEADFRHCGYTIEALAYPLTEQAVRGLAHKNGLSFEQYVNISPAVWYAPNEVSRVRCELHGEAHARGCLHKDEEGRWCVTAKSARCDGKT